MRVQNKRIEAIEIGGKQYPRSNYHFGEPGDHCHDCGVEFGEIHIIGCDVEKCPACEGQLISCKCDHNYHI